MNKLIGLAIVLLYFLNYHICNFLFPTNVTKFWDLKVCIYSLIIVLAVKYDTYKTGVLGFIESILISIIINNVFSLYFFEDKNYSHSDLVVITLVIIFEYAKHFKRNFRQYFDSFF
jgi:hypothetical protein